MVIIISSVIIYGIFPIELYKDGVNIISRYKYPMTFRVLVPAPPADFLKQKKYIERKMKMLANKNKE